MITPRFIVTLSALVFLSAALAQRSNSPAHPIVLRAARLLEIESGRLLAPGEVLVQGERIAEVGSSVSHPAGAEIIDLGDSTLLPGLIDAHVHLFLHPGAEDLQTMEEAVPQRTILAVLAARDDLMAGFTAERDMGTEGAGSADTAVRNAIDQGLVPGPRLRISGNAVDILGGHEDAIRFNPDQHVLPNATWANSIPELIAETPRCPVICHFGRLDASIPQAVVDRIAETFPDIPLYSYDAGHGFASDRRADFEPDSARLARLRTLQLFARAGGRGEF